MLDFYCAFGVSVTPTRPAAAGGAPDRARGRGEAAAGIGAIGINDTEMRLKGAICAVLYDFSAQLT